MDFQDSKNFKFRETIKEDIQKIMIFFTLGVTLSCFTNQVNY